MLYCQTPTSRPGGVPAAAHSTTGRCVKMVFSVLKPFGVVAATVRHFFLEIVL